MSGDGRAACAHSPSASNFQVSQRVLVALWIFAGPRFLLHLAQRVAASLCGSVRCVSSDAQGPDGRKKGVWPFRWDKMNCESASLRLFFPCGTECPPGMLPLLACLGFRLFTRMRLLFRRQKDTELWDYAL